MKTRVILFLMMSLILLAGCNDSNNPLLNGDILKNDDNQVTTQITVPILNYRTLNPMISQDESAYQINQLIYDGLIQINSSWEAEPCLASDWKYEDEGKTLIFHLKENVKWHDGSAFTANDVVFTMNAILNPGSNMDSRYKIFLANVNHAEKIDNYTVKIKFKSSYDNAIENFVFPIIKASYYSSYKDVYNKIDDYNPMGTGAYKVLDIERFKYIQLEKNENYFGKIPDNNIKMEIVPSLEDSISLLEIDDIHITLSKQSDWNKYLQNKNLRLNEFISNEAEVTGFNCNHPVLKNKMVRQTIAYAIDTDKIIQNIYLGAAAKSDIPYIPSYLGSNAYTGAYALNLKKSQSLLEEAGFINRDKDEYLEDSDGRELKFNLLVNKENKKRVDSAELIKKHLKQAGIMIDITYLDYDNYINKIKRDQYDIFLGGLSLSHLMDLRFALHSQLENFTNYQNDYLDFLLVEMQRNLSPQQKKEYFEEIRETLMTDMPYYTLCFKKYALITEKKLQGNIKPDFINIYRGIESWYVEK